MSLKASFHDLLRRHSISRQTINGLIERLGLSPALLERRPTAVSGGELQRLALARVLALNPSVILADEPTADLDSETAHAVSEGLLALASRGSTLIVATHDMDLAARLDFVIDLGAGE